MKIRTGIDCVCNYEYICVYHYTRLVTRALNILAILGMLFSAYIAYTNNILVGFLSAAILIISIICTYFVTKVMKDIISDDMI